MVASPVSVYERMAGGCTALVASQLLDLCPLAISESSHILDNACGPAVVSAAIKRRHPRARVLAADVSPDMLALVEAKRAHERWTGLDTLQADARDMPAAPAATFSHVFINFGVLVPGDPESARKIAAEARRVLMPGGVLMLSSWAERGFPAAFYATMRRFRPGYETPPGGILGDLPDSHRASWLLGQLEAAGFGGDVAVRPVTTYTSARSFDELVDNLLLARKMFFAELSDEEIEEARPVFRGEVRRLREFEELQDGTARIRMRAWIATAWKDGG